MFALLKKSANNFIVHLKEGQGQLEYSPGCLQGHKVFKTSLLMGNQLCDPMTESCIYNYYIPITNSNYYRNWEATVLLLEREHLNLIIFFSYANLASVAWGQARKGTSLPLRELVSVLWHPVPQSLRTLGKKQ